MRKGTCNICGIVTIPHKCPHKRDTRRSKLLNVKGWASIRKEVIERDSGLCQLCKHNGVLTGAPFVVHHIIERSCRPDLANDPNNCITLCHQCHENIVHKTRNSSKDYIELFQSIVKEK